MVGGEEKSCSGLTLFAAVEQSRSGEIGAVRPETAKRDYCCGVLTVNVCVYWGHENFGGGR